MKRTYIKPDTKCISLHATHHLATISTNNIQGVTSTMLSRENESLFDEEEEEEDNLGGWFK